MSDMNNFFSLERVGSDGKIIKIRFTRDVTPTRSTAFIVAAINKCFKHGFHCIIIDMEKIHLPHNLFIATLIEATSKVRRKNGDIKIINLSEHAKQTMAGFSAYSYLSIISKES